MRGLALAALLLALGSAGGAAAFSFGDFTPGDKIETLIVESGDGMSFTPGTPGTLSVRAEISTIEMVSGTIFGGISGLRFEMDLDLSGSPLFLPPVGPTLVDADFAAGSVIIRDDGDGPNGPVLLTGNFLDLLGFGANFDVLGLNGSLSGSFGEISGDPLFTTPFGSGADLNLQLSAFSGTQICHLGNTCIGPTTAFSAWTAQPTATVNPIPLPEPSTALLLGLGLGGLALVQRKRRYPDR
jgi:hypothetical protein